MRMALTEAKKGANKTYRNPLVGAVIVKNKQVIASGYHQEYGGPHAEINAFKQLNNPEDCRQGTLFVTLEPCSHYGKTPPCVEEIIKMGICKVVIGELDANPLVAGKGVAILLNAGIEVEVGVLEQEVKEMNIFYRYFHQHKKPYITIKYGSTLDGKINQVEGQRAMITGSETWEDVQKERRKYQGILVGSQTVLVDNPLLTIRSGEGLGYPPIRIILDRRGRITEEFQLIQEDSAPTWIFTSNPKSKKLEDNEHVRVFIKNPWTLLDIVNCLAKHGVQSILVEGGSHVHDQFIASDLVNQVLVYIAPKIFGGTSLSAISSRETRPETSQLLVFQEIIQIGEDLKIRGVFEGRETRCLQE